jgi:hypothetical protein
MSQRPAVMFALLLLAISGCERGPRTTITSLPSPSPSPTAPRIVAIRWDRPGTGTPIDSCPAPGELATVTCQGRDDDGDAYTITVTIESLGPGTLSSEFPARVTASFPPEIRVSGKEVRAFFVLETSTARVRAVCETVDSHGLRETRTSTCL